MGQRVNQEQALHTNRRMEVHCDTILGTFTKLLKAAISFVMSVCLSAKNDSSPTGRILIKSEV